MDILTPWRKGRPPCIGLWLTRSVLIWPWSAGSLLLWKDGDWHHPDGEPLNRPEEKEWRGLAFNPEAIEWTLCLGENGADGYGWFIPPNGLAYKKES